MNKSKHERMNNDYVLFLDDTRDIPDRLKGYAIIARSYDDAIKILKWCGCPLYLLLDHDLGEEKTGYDFVKHFCDEVLNKNLILPKGFEYFVHSQNPVGKKNIENYMENFLEMNGYLNKKEY